jgi:CubicO group peptidase (beta-lactamase class C family)
MNYWWALNFISGMSKSLLILFSIVLLVSCDEVLLKDEAGISIEQNLSIPESLGDGWDVSSPGREGADSAALFRLIRDLQSDSRRIHGLLIVKNNKLIVESYFDGWHRNRLQSMRSASKSIASTLVGIAIDKGFIVGIDQSILDFFPEYADLRTADKDKIQLQHVLSMTAGLHWDQDSFPPEDPRNDEYQLDESDDGFRYLLEKNVVSTPGKNFKYNSGCSDLLLGIVDHTAKISADRFAEDYLFKPLGIESYGWRKSNNGYPNGGYGLHMYPRDIIKVGQMFLDSGKWKGNQIVSSSWVKQATSEYISLDDRVGYGFQWWIWNERIGEQMVRRYQAQGKGGQIICVVPEFNAVIVMTGANFDNYYSQIPYAILRNRILPALSSD